MKGRAVHKFKNLWLNHFTLCLSYIKSVLKLYVFVYICKNNWWNKISLN